MKQDWRIEPMVLLLFVGVFLAIGAMIFVEFKFPNDGQVFQVVAGIAANFQGAMLLRIKGQSKDDPPPPGTSEIKKTTVSSVEVTPPADPPKP